MTTPEHLGSPASAGLAAGRSVAAGSAVTAPGALGLQPAGGDSPGDGSTATRLRHLPLVAAGGSTQGWGSQGSVPHGRKPAWLKVRAPGGERYSFIKHTLRGLDLHTVCEEARCPNVGECWGSGTATVMLLGDTCTRGCRFCAVKTGDPRGAVDPREPEHVARAVGAMQLDYVVLTMVDRDDLLDGGAGHVAHTVLALHERQPRLLVEALTGDFSGRARDVERVVDSRPDVFAHNIEVTRRLTALVRDRRCDYDRSLDVLRCAKQRAPERLTKSSVMLGLGETRDEVLQTLADLRGVGVDIVTLGQYLRPSPRHLPLDRYVEPEEFSALERAGLALGFACVAAGPLVRSSYRAAEVFVASRVRGEASEGQASTGAGQGLSGQGSSGQGSAGEDLSGPRVARRALP